MKALSQQSPIFLAPGTSFTEDNFSTDGRRDGFGMFQAHCIQAHLLLCGLVPDRPGLAPMCSWEGGDPCIIGSDRTGFEPQLYYPAG